MRLIRIIIYCLRIYQSIRLRIANQQNSQIPIVSMNQLDHPQDARF